MNTRTIVGIIALSFVLAITVPYYLAWFWEGSSWGSDYHMPVETTIGIRVNKTAAGDWQLQITGGSKPVSSLTLQVANQTGEIVFKKTFASIKIPSSDPDAAFNDTDRNNNVNAGDTILLKASGGHVQAGYEVRLLRGDLVLGLLRSLP
jgi:hypothetical protein